MVGVRGHRLVALGLVLLASMVAQSFGRFTYPVLLKAIDAEVLHSLTKAGSLGTVSLGAYLVGTAIVSWASTRFDPTSIVKVGLTFSLVGILVLWTGVELRRARRGPGGGRAGQRRGVGAGPGHRRQPRPP